MPRPCKVQNCVTGKKKCEVDKLHCFKAPANETLLNEWKKIIPNLKSTDHVCERHFEEDCILRNRIMMDSNGKILLNIPYERPRLLFEKNPVPTLEVETNETINNSTDDISWFQEFKIVFKIGNNENIRLPEGWNASHLELESKRVILFAHISTKSESSAPIPVVEKYVTIDEEKNIQYFIQQKNVQSDYLIRTMTDISHLPNILVGFQSFKYCQGSGFGYKHADLSRETEWLDQLQILRHSNCSMLDYKRCTYCSRLRRSINRKQIRVNQQGSKNHTVTSSSSRIRSHLNHVKTDYNKVYKRCQRNKTMNEFP